MHLATPLRALLELPEQSRVLGPFRLVRQLGRGGFAPVWLAREVYGTRELRSVAVKLFAFDGGTQSVDPLGATVALAAHRERVIEEAQALCQVEHPNIVRFVALPIDEARGIVGLAMEYLAGTSIDARIAERGKLAVRETVDAALAVARALVAVHAVGLVHRDVKPANVVEAGGTHKLIDFGIASAERPPEAAWRGGSRRQRVLDDLPLDVVGSKMSELAFGSTTNAPVDAGLTPIVTGTLGYIDPVCVATGAPAVPASDLYGLGAMLYECLSGKVPAAAAAPPGMGLRGEVLDGRAHAVPIRSLDASIPEELASLVDALVAPTREARPASAELVLAALEHLRAAPPVAPPPMPSELPPPPSRSAVPRFEPPPTAQSLPPATRTGSSSSTSGRGSPLLVVGALGALFVAAATIAVVVFMATRGATPLRAVTAAGPPDVAPPPPQSTPRPAAHLPPPPWVLHLQDGSCQSPCLGGSSCPDRTTTCRTGFRCIPGATGDTVDEGTRWDLHLYQIDLKSGRGPCRSAIGKGEVCMTPPSSGVATCVAVSEICARAVADTAIPIAISDLVNKDLTIEVRVDGKVVATKQSPLWAGLDRQALCTGAQVGGFNAEPGFDVGAVHFLLLPVGTVLPR